MADAGAGAFQFEEQGSRILRRWNEQRRRERALRARAPRGQRSFAAAGTGALLHSWSTQDRHVNQALQVGLRTLRARSRDLERNNDYAKHFLRMVTDNIAGPQGALLQVQAKRPDGSLDVADSSYIEDAFARWGKRQGCDVSQRLSWIAMQRLGIRTIARDGEILVRRWPGRGPFGYQLQLLDPGLLSEHHNEDLGNGRRIRMGVELDEFDAPVAYHLARRPVNDPRLTSGVYGYDLDTVRVPASEIWHLFVPEAVGQYRGVPWMATTLIRQKRLDSYEEAALAAAEEGAKKLAWISSPEGTLAPLADDGVDENGNPVATPEAGTLYTDSGDGIHYGSLPPGFSVEAWDPKYPAEGYDAFVTQQVRGIATGLGVAYHKLGNNLEGVNFSSARAGELAERDVWIGLQSWFIDEFCAPVYSEWLPLAILAGELALPISKLSKFDAAVWQGRRWDWVDPEKDVDAGIKAMGAKLLSRRRFIQRMGLDPEEVWAEIEAEERRFGPVSSGSAPPPKPTEQPKGEPTNV